MSRGPRRLAVLVVIALITVGCGGGDSTSSGAEGPDSTGTTAQAARPAFPSNTTMAALQNEGKLVVGTKFDQPGFGLKGVSGKVEGFDVEIAKLIAESIFGEDVDDKVEFIESVSANREPFIQQGRVDIVVATYTINDERKKVVDFAGPYYIAGQDIMVKADNDAIKGVEDLNGKKVCTVQGSTSLQNVQREAPQADLSITFDTYSKCAEALSAGRVEAVTTDNIILLGYVDESEGEFKLVDNTFTEEPYGIGLKKGDDEFRDFINDRLEEIYESGEWEEAYESTVGQADEGETPEPPPVDRY
jgi:glutamate transport system substrate-binding protein